MQVILKQNIKSLGKKGEIKNVKEGYYHNFLLPRNLAELATPAKIQEAASMLKRQVVEKDRIKEKSSEIKAQIDKLTITLKAKAKGEKLYGSITEKEILDALQAKLNVRLEKEHLLLPEHIKMVGTYTVPVRLIEGVEAKFILEIKGEK